MPYWSEERLFGTRGPTNRLVFRCVLIAVALAIGVMAWVIIGYVDYAHKVDNYIHEARTARDAQNAQLQQQVTQNKRAIARANEALRVAHRQTRDLVCFTVQFSQAQPSFHGNKFIHQLNTRYHCKGYVIGSVNPGRSPPPSGPGSGPNNSGNGSGNGHRRPPRTPGPSPSGGPSPPPHTSSPPPPPPSPSTPALCSVVHRVISPLPVPIPCPF